jgi:hypothetical protein
MSLTRHRTTWRTAALALLLAAGAAAAQPLSDNELFEQGRDAYESGDWVRAAMLLYAYTQRDPAAMRQNPTHREQVNAALEFSRQRPGQLERDLRQDLDSCEQSRAEMADRCGETVTASTRSYMIHRPTLEALAATTATPKTYPLVCRGGPGLTLTWMPDASALGTQSALVLRYRKGNRAVGENPGRLAPGECSWRDRGMRPGEPARLCYPLEVTRFTVSWSPADRRVRRLGDGVPDSLAGLGRPERHAVFQVYNNRRGCMMAVVPRLQLMQPLTSQPRIRPELVRPAQ